MIVLAQVGGATGLRLFITSSAGMVSLIGR